MELEVIHRGVFSHGGDPTSSIEHKDKIESIEAIKILMKIIEDSDQNHYRILVSSVS